MRYRPGSGNNNYCFGLADAASATEVLSALTRAASCGLRIASYAAARSARAETSQLTAGLTCGVRISYPAGFRYSENQHAPSVIRIVSQNLVTSNVSI
jgi:hypothetical protein